MVSRLSKGNSKFSDGNSKFSDGDSFIVGLFESLIALISTELVETSILLTLFCEEFSSPRFCSNIYFINITKHIIVHFFLFFI